MDLPARDRTAPDVAPLPAREPGLPLARHERAPRVSRGALVDDARPGAVRGAGERRCSADERTIPQRERERERRGPRRASAPPRPGRRPGPSRRVTGTGAAPGSRLPSGVLAARTSTTGIWLAALAAA